MISPTCYAPILPAVTSMNLLHLRCLRGPNVWAACPVIEAALDLSDATSWSAKQLGQTLHCLEANRLGSTNGTTEDGKRPLFRLAQAFALAAQKLQILAGTPVS